VETIFDLYESEVKKIMLNIREESLRNILSAVGAKRIVAALGDEETISTLGEEKIISALGEEKIISALGKQKIIAALGGSENLLKELLATLTPEQLRQMIEETSRN